MQNSFEILGPDGPFSKKTNWFAVRDCQREMADCIESAIKHNQCVIAESGTGTGKTFAYLIPPLLAKKKTIISTRTKSLQEQLFQKDIPEVCEVLGIYPAVRQLKGRSNYFCLLMHENANRQPEMFASSSKINRVYNSVLEHGDGDISEYRLTNEDRKSMTATSDTCVGRKCDFWKSCYANLARTAAREADVVVVNHSLLSLLINSNEDSIGVLNDAEVIVIDEAHRFPEIAAQSLGTMVSKERIGQFCKNLEQCATANKLDLVWVATIAEKLTACLERISKHLNEGNSQVAISDLSENNIFMNMFSELIEIMSEIVAYVEKFIDVSVEIEKCCEVAKEIVVDAKYIFERDNDDVASWCETSKRGFTLNRIPLEPHLAYGRIFNEFEGSWIFTSATLAVGDDFSLFENRMGLHNALATRWESPFDFENQTLIYLPRELPNPSFRDIYDANIAEIVRDVTPRTKGGVLVLFTSHQSMRNVKSLLKDRLNCQLLCQGDDSVTNLLEEFKQDGNSVLLGTMSFWEGIDLRGEVLSCVIIEKLPFAHPANPIESARQAYMTREDKNYFQDWSLPNAVLTFKQGAGRLIRDDSDRGMLIICDPRIRTKSYGQTFIDSLPKMPLTDDINQIQNFFST